MSITQWCSQVYEMKTTVFGASNSNLQLLSYYCMTEESKSIHSITTIIRIGNNIVSGEEVAKLVWSGSRYCAPS